MDDSLHQLLRRTLRRTIHSWWKTWGAWFIALLVVVYGVSIAILAGNYMGSMPLADYAISLRHDALGYLIAGLAWLSLASRINLEISRLLDQEAIPYSDEITRARYQISLRYGIPILGLGMLLSCTAHLTLWLSSSNLGFTAFEPAAIVSSVGTAVLYVYTPLVLSMLWLCGMMALAPGHRYLAWILLGTGLCVEFIHSWQLDIKADPYWMSGPYFSPWYFIGVIVLIGLFAALIIKRWRVASYIVYALGGLMIVSCIVGIWDWIASPGQIPSWAEKVSFFSSWFWVCPYTVLPAAPFVILNTLHTILLPFPDPATIHPVVNLLINLVWIAAWLYGIHLLMLRVILRRQSTATNQNDG